MYNHVFVAGTFDQLHKGHQYLLQRAFSEGKDVTIGLTTDDFIRIYKGDAVIAPFPERKKQLTNWLMECGKLPHCVVIPISDALEPAASDFFDAIIVTPDNRFRGEQINDLRRQRELQPLALIEVPLIQAGDGMPISSTRIRHGEIDKNGRLVMPEKLRLALSQPIGELLKDTQIPERLAQRKNDIVITVGDMTTHVVMSAGITPSLAVIDLKVGRKPYQPVTAYKFESLPVVKVQSGPGYISYAALTEIEVWAERVAKREAHSERVLLVDGEDDLLALPVIMHAPVGSFVYYGQPHTGLVEVPITEQKIVQVRALLDQFEINT